jgi:hypothetical protein
MTSTARVDHYVDPVIKPVPIDSLRPTQITVGRKEVEDKRKRWKAQGIRKEMSYVKDHMIPVIVGPKGNYYILDHHHLSLALHEEGVEKVFVTVRANYSKLDRQAFWFVLDNLNLMHPFDANGVRQSYDAIPKRITGLVDDPYRSLAGSLRRAGGYAKSDASYVEFLWADFLRRRITRRQIETDFGGALDRALQLARSEETDYLPGWAGPDEE